MLRVIRGLLAIKSSYSKDELSKPFVVPRIVFSPDLSDPDIRRAMISAGIKSIEAAYGTSQTPAFDHKTNPIEIPIDDHSDEHGGEYGATMETAHTTSQPEPDPFEMPTQPEPEAVPEIKSLDEFRKLKPEQIEPAIRALMKRKNYKESSLRDPKIAGWVKDMHEKFVTALLTFKDAQ
jgi:hypothetical protein